MPGVGCPEPPARSAQAAGLPGTRGGAGGGAGGGGGAQLHLEALPQPQPRRRRVGAHGDGGECEPLPDCLCSKCCLSIPGKGQSPWGAVPWGDPRLVLAAERAHELQPAAGGGAALPLPAGRRPTGHRVAPSRDTMKPAGSGIDQHGHPKLFFCSVPPPRSGWRSRTRCGPPCALSPTVPTPGEAQAGGGWAVQGPRGCDALRPPGHPRTLSPCRRGGVGAAVGADPAGAARHGAGTRLLHLGTLRPPG